MKKNLSLSLILAAGLLILPAFCLATTNYVRTPAGYTIFDTQNPVQFHVWWDHDPCPNIWRVVVENTTTIYQSEEYTSSYNNIYFSPTLPIADYIRVWIKCRTSGGEFWAEDLEYASGTTIFEIIAQPPPPPPTPVPIITIASTSPVSILAYTGQLFTDTETLVILVIGLTSAFLMIRMVKNLTNPEEKMIKEKKADKLGAWREPKSKKSDWL